MGKNLLAQSSPEDIVDKFFDFYKHDSTDKALDYIFSTNKFASEAQEPITNLKEKLSKAFSLEGIFRGYELVSEKKVGQSYALMVFLVKHDRAPLTFRILFYKPAEKWQVQNFNFDNNMDDELVESSKTFLIK